MDCPLPIDWLDYLEKRESELEVDLVAHLADCRRCQALVDELREQSVGVSLAPYQGAALARVPKWPDEVRAEVVIGDVWLSKGEFAEAYADLRRQIVLVIAKRQEFNQTWFSVVPVATDADLATSSDLLLEPNDTTLNVPLVAQFRLQTPLAPEQLDSYLGAATDSGRELIERALAGTLSSEHFGAALTRANERRLRRVEETRKLMVNLASVYGEALVRAEQAEEAEPANDPEPEVVTLAPAAQRQEARIMREREGDEGARVFVFQLKRVKPSVPERLMELAAATFGHSNPLINHFAFEGERCTLRARLELKGQMRGEEMLLLFIEHVSGFPSAPMLVSFAKPTGERVVSPPFDPTREDEIVVARGAVGISPAEVDELELRPS